MADAQQAPKVAVDENVILDVINTFDQLEAWIDGATTASGMHARPPIDAMNHMDLIRGELHALVCSTCAANNKAHEARDNIRHLNTRNPTGGDKV